MPPPRPDTPIEEFDQDRLDRATFARALGKVIAAYDRPENLVVGLYGEWGLGKTSLLNLALKSISQTEPPPIIVRFNPWYFADQDNLVRQFFASLAIAIVHQDKSTHYQHIVERLQFLEQSIEALGAVPGVDVVAKPASGLAGIFRKRAEKKAKDAESLDSIKKEISDALVSRMSA